MNRIKYPYFPVGIRPKQFIKKLWITLLVIGLIEIIVYMIAFIPATEIYYLYQENGQKTELLRAIQWYDLVIDSGMPYVLLGGSILSMIVPAILFYGNFTKDHSIYTILRTPTKRKVRIATFTDYLVPSILGGISLWITQLCLLVLFYVAYMKFIPVCNQAPEYVTYFFQQSGFAPLFFSKGNLLSYLGKISYWVLLPAIGLLVLFLVRNVKKGGVAVLCILLSGITIFAMATAMTTSMAMVPRESFFLILANACPIVTSFAVLAGIYYINQVELC